MEDKLSEIEVFVVLVDKSKNTNEPGYKRDFSFTMEAANVNSAYGALIKELGLDD